MDGTYEANPLAWNSFDKPLVCTVVSDRRARGIDATCECGLRNDAPVPDRRNEVVPADNTIALLDQIGQQIEYLRFKVEQNLAAAKLAPLTVERIVIESKDHVAPPQCSNYNTTRDR